MEQSNKHSNNNLNEIQELISSNSEMKITSENRDEESDRIIGNTENSLEAISNRNSFEYHQQNQQQQHPPPPSPSLLQHSRPTQPTATND